MKSLLKNIKLLDIYQFLRCFISRRFIDNTTSRVRIFNLEFYLRIPESGAIFKISTNLRSNHLFYCVYGAKIYLISGFVGRWKRYLSIYTSEMKNLFDNSITASKRTR